MLGQGPQRVSYEFREVSATRADDKPSRSTSGSSTWPTGSRLLKRWLLLPPIKTLPKSLVLSSNVGPSSGSRRGTNDQGSECCPRPKGQQRYTRSSSIRPQSRSDSFHPSSSTCLNRTLLPLYSPPTPTAPSLDWPRKWTSFPPLNHPRLAEVTDSLVLPAGATWTTQQKSGLDRTGSRLLVLFSPMIDGEVDTISTRS